MRPGRERQEGHHGEINLSLFLFCREAREKGVVALQLRVCA